MGPIYPTRNSYSREVTIIRKGREYLFFDFLFWSLGTLNSLKSMCPENVITNFFIKIPQIDVPVVFINRSCDMNNPVS